MTIKRDSVENANDQCRQYARLIWEMRTGVRPVLKADYYSVVNNYRCWRLVRQIARAKESRQ